MTIALVFEDVTVAQDALTEELDAALGQVLEGTTTLGAALTVKLRDGATAEHVDTARAVVLAHTPRQSTGEKREANRTHAIRALSLHDYTPLFETIALVRDDTTRGALEALGKLLVQAVAAQGLIADVPPPFKNGQDE